MIRVNKFQMIVSVVADESWPNGDSRWTERHNCCKEAVQVLAPSEGLLAHAATGDQSAADKDRLSASSKAQGYIYIEWNAQERHFQADSASPPVGPGG